MKMRIDQTERGSCGDGATSRPTSELAREMLLRQLSKRTDLVHVPYKLMFGEILQYMNTISNEG